MDIVILKIFLDKTVRNVTNSHATPFEIVIMAMLQLGA